MSQWPHTVRMKLEVELESMVIIMSAKNYFQIFFIFGLISHKHVFSAGKYNPKMFLCVVNS